MRRQRDVVTGRQARELARAVESLSTAVRSLAIVTRVLTEQHDTADAFEELRRLEGRVH
jgi:hypothetical protein